MILTDVRQNKTPGSKHTSLIFYPDPSLMTLDLLGNLFANFKVSVGQLQKLDGTVVQPTDNVYLGDALKVVLNTPNTNGASAASIVYQNDVAVGYFVLTTENIVTYSYDSRYNDLFTSEVVPDVAWVPAVENSIKSFDFDGALTGTYDLTVAPTNLFAQNAITALDYQRNTVKVFDTDTKTLSKVISGSGPISSSNLFGSDRVRAATAVAFRKADVVKLYDSFFSEALSIPSLDVAGVHFHQNTLYVWTKTGTRLFSYTINPVTLAIVSQTTHDFSGTIQAVISYNTQVLILSETELVDLTDTVLCLLDLKARNAVVNNDLLYVTHGYSPFVSKISLTDFSVNKLNIVGAAFLDSITAQSSGRIYVTDVEAKKVYAREEFNQEWDVGFGGYGIALNDQVYLFDAYPTMPSKIDVDTLQYTLEASAFVDINDFPLGAVGTTGNIDILTANRPVKVQLFPANPYTTLLKNGIPVTDETTVSSGDELRIQFDFEFGQSDPMLLGLVIDQQTFVINVFLDDSRIVPFDFKFQPQFGVSPNILVTSNIVTISHLTNPVTVNTDLGVFVKNGIEVGASTVIANGDSLAVRLTSASDFCSVTTAKITIQDPRFETPFSVSTVADIPDGATAARPDLTFDTVYDQPLGKTIYSSEIRLTDKIYEATEFTIPDFYDAEFIHNGIPSGKQITVQTNDTIQIKLITTYNYDTPHNVAISTCYGVGVFVAYTVGDITPDPFNFGTIQGAHIKDYLVSDTTTINGIGNNVQVPVLIPYGTKLFKNGAVINNPRPVDWRGMPVEDYATLLPLSNGDTLRLEGYPRPIQGQTVNIYVYVGGRRGSWTVNTFDSSNATNVDHPEYYVQGFELQESDWIFDIGIPRSYDVQVIPASKINSATVVQVKTESSSYKPIETNHTVSPSYDVVGVDLLNTLHLNQPVVNFTFDRDLITSRGFEFVQSGMPEIETRTSNKPLAFDFDLDLYISDTNQLFVDLDLQMLVSDTNQLFVDPNTDFGLVGSNTTAFEYHVEYHVNKSNDPLYCTVLEVDRYDAIKANYGHVSILTEFVVVSFDYKPFQLFDLSDSIAFNYSANPRFEREFVWQNVPWLTPEIAEIYYVNQPLVQIEASTWIKWGLGDTFKLEPVFNIVRNNDRTYIENEFKVVPNYEHVFYMATCKVSEVHEFVGFNPQYAKQNSAEPVTFSVDVKTRSSDRQNTLSLLSTVHEKTKPVLLDYDTNAEVRKNSAPVLFDLIIADYDFRGCDIVVGQELSVEQSRTYLRSPQPNTLHPGYFATKELAEANAIAHGYGIGQFYALDVEEKGWAWTRVIPCSNLCNPDDCPPSGYIHGG